MDYPTRIAKELASALPYNMPVELRRMVLEYCPREIRFGQCPKDCPGTDRFGFDERDCFRRYCQIEKDGRQINIHGHTISFQWAMTELPVACLVSSPWTFRIESNQKTNGPHGWWLAFGLMHPRIFSQATTPCMSPATPGSRWLNGGVENSWVVSTQPLLHTCNGTISGSRPAGPRLADHVGCTFTFATDLERNTVHVTVSSGTGTTQKQQYFRIDETEAGGRLRNLAELHPVALLWGPGCIVSVGHSLPLPH